MDGKAWLDAGLFFLRILLPVLTVGVAVGCFHSMKAGRRREEPVMVLEDIVSKKRIPVLYWENSIGRSKSCDVVVADMTASRDHAVLMRRESGWIVKDTESKSGTRVNGKKVDPEGKAVLPGDVITVGSTSLMLKRTTEAPVRVPKQRRLHAASPFSLMMWVTVIQVLLLLQACFSSGAFSLLPVLPFVGLLVLEWGLYVYSIHHLNRVSFELETLGFLLSGISVLLLSGMRTKPQEGQALPDMLALVDGSMKETYVQLAAVFLGILLFCFLIWFMNDLDRVMRWRLGIAVGAILLFLANLVLAKESNGARNWISLGFISIQPSEFIKIAFVFVGASTLDRLQTARNLSGFIFFSAACMIFLFLMRDFGTACIFFVTFLVIAFMRSGSIRTIFLALAAAGLGAFLILQFRPYVLSRFEGWRHVWEYVNESQGYQQVRVLSYSASGGLLGLGIGNGKLGGGTSGTPVFAADSDLVFGMLCEELGLIMAVCCVCLLAALAVYARSESTKSRSTFYSICSCAAASMLLFQACLNVFGSTDVLPLTGVTLPFISAGGSSMAAVWGMLAFLKAADERTYAARRSKAKAPARKGGYGR